MQNCTNKHKKSCCVQNPSGALQDVKIFQLHWGKLLLCTKHGRFVDQKMKKMTEKDKIFRLVSEKIGGGEKQIILHSQNISVKTQKMLGKNPKITKNPKILQKSKKKSKFRPDSPSNTHQW